MEAFKQETFQLDTTVMEIVNVDDDTHDVATIGIMECGKSDENDGQDTVITSNESGHSSCKNDNNPTEESTDLSENHKLESRRNHLFAYGGLLIGSFNLLASVAWIITYVRGYGWTRNPAAFALDLEEPVEESNEANRRLTDAHAIMGLLVLLMCTFQFASTLLFGMNEKETLGYLMRVGHRIVGRILFLVAIATVITGAVFTITSDRFHHNAQEEEYNLMTRIGTAALFWFGGIGVLVNFTIGLKQVMFVKEKTPQRMLIHKGCMFFGFFYIGRVGLSEIVVTIVQVITSHCALGDFGAIICFFVSDFIQVTAMLLAFWRSEPSLFEQAFVRYNLIAIMSSLFLGFLPIPYFLVYRPDDDTCLGSQQ